MPVLKRSVDQLRRTLTKPAYAPERESSRRTMHGGTAWAMVADEENTPLYQPQDSPSGIRRAAAVAAESEDARLTGGTRSLMRRLSGLNLSPAKSLRTVPQTPVTVA